MSIQDLLLKGSFRGVEFNFVAAGTSKGRRVEIDEFINSEDIEYEDLGKSRESFDLRIRLSARGTAYFVNRANLEAALDEPGAAELVHPTRGRFTAIVDGRYSINEELNSLGEMEFNVKFTVVDAGIFKLKSTSTIQVLFEFANVIAKLKAEEMTEDYGLSTIDSIKQAQKYVNDLSKKFKKVQNLIEDPKAAGEFASQLLGFEKGTFTAAFGLARDTYMLYYNANNLIESALDRFNFFKDLFGFGDDDPEIPSTTRARVENANNQVIQNSVVQIDALVFATFAAAEIEYTTDEELNENVELIQAQFIKVMSSVGTNTEQYNALQEQRVEFTILMKDLTLSVSRIIEIDVENIGLSTLIYQYYGLAEGLDGYDTVYDLIIGLNNFDETGSITGTIKIITEQGA